MELTYGSYLEHYGVKGMKWGVRKSDPIGSKAAIKKAQAEVERAAGQGPGEIKKAKRNLETAISNREKFKKEKSAFRKEEYTKIKEGLIGSSGKIAATGAGVVTGMYGGLGIPAYNVGRSQGLSKGKAVAAAALGGPLANVAIAEIRSTSKARQKISK